MGFIIEKMGCPALINLIYGLQPFRSMYLLEVNSTDILVIKIKCRNVQNLESRFPIHLTTKY